MQHERSMREGEDAKLGQVVRGYGLNEVERKGIEVAPRVERVMHSQNQVEKQDDGFGDF